MHVAGILASAWRGCTPHIHNVGFCFHWSVSFCFGPSSCTSVLPSLAWAIVQQQPHNSTYALCRFGADTEEHACRLSHLHWLLYRWLSGPYRGRLDFARLLTHGSHHPQPRILCRRAIGNVLIATRCAFTDTATTDTGDQRCEPWELQSVAPGYAAYVRPALGPGKVGGRTGGRD